MEDAKPPGLNIVEYAAAVCGLLISLGIIFGGFMKLYNKSLQKKINAEVDAALKVQTETLKKALEEATKPIHPEANGGFSLPDVAKQVTKLDSKLDDMRRDITEVKTQTRQNTVGLSELRRLQQENNTTLNTRMDEAELQRSELGEIASKQASDIQEKNYPEEPQ